MTDHFHYCGLKTSPKIEYLCDAMSGRNFVQKLDVSGMGIVNFTWNRPFEYCIIQKLEMGPKTGLVF